MSRASVPVVRAAGKLVMLLALAGCAAEAEPDARAGALRLRGPLLPLLEWRPASPAECPETADSVVHQGGISRVRSCVRRSAGRIDLVNVAEDGRVASAISAIEVAAGEGVAAMARMEGELAGRLGAGRRCGGSRVTWAAGDTLHAWLELTRKAEEGADSAAAPWQVTRVVRLGPLHWAESEC